MSKKQTWIFVTVIIFLSLGCVVWQGANRITRMNQKHVLLKQDELEKELGEKVNSKELQNQMAEKILSWYEVQELGIKFKVTPDTLQDLQYKVKKYQMKNSNIEITDSIFFSDSETNESFEGCQFSEVGSSCGRFQLNRVSKIQIQESQGQKEESWCEGFGGKTILQDEKELVCLFKGEIDFSSDSGYRNYFHYKDTTEKKEFGIFLNSMELVN